MTKEEIAIDRDILSVPIASPDWAILARSRWTAALDALEAANERLARFDAAWEKWKHLDHLLSDAEWLDASTNPMVRTILPDLWQAVRKEGS